MKKEVNVSSNKKEKRKNAKSKTENHAFIDWIWVKMYLFKYVKNNKNISMLTIFAWFDENTQEKIIKSQRKSQVVAVFMKF